MTEPRPLIAGNWKMNGRRADGLALAGAKAIGVSLPQTASAAQLMQACASNGWGQLDHSALVKSLELLAAHAVAEG